MKKQACVAVICFFLLTSIAGSAFAEKKPDSPLVQYLAGIELIVSDAKLSPARRATLYRRLCVITGLRCESKAMILGYKNDPEAWQRLQASVAAVLDKRG